MVQLVSGDYWTSRSDVLVNPVNCEGVVGEGLSAAFKERFPRNFGEYVRVCKEGDLHPGGLHVFNDPSGKVIINAATQAESAAPSNLDWVQALAEGLSTWVGETGPPQIAVPALGTGCGALPWLPVRDILIDVLDDAPGDIEIWAPLDYTPPILPQEGHYASACIGHTGKPAANADYSLVSYIRFSRGDDAKTYNRKIGCYHPSAVSLEGCNRALAYERLAVTPRPVPRTRGFGVNVFDLGDAIHDAIQNRLLKVVGIHGQRFTPEVEISYPPLGLYGHCDGVFGQLVVEIKSVSKSIFKGLKAPMDSHIRQLHCYMLALDIPYGVILYVCRDNGEFREFPIQFKGDVLARIATTIHNIEAHLRRGVIPEPEPNSFICSRCKFLYTCKPDLAKDE